MKQAKLAAALAGLLALIGLWASPAAAHAKLQQTTPGGGETVVAFPAAVTLQFSEKIEASFAGIQVFSPTGERVDADPAEVSGSTVRLPLPARTEPGAYVVVFRVLSADGHPVESRFTFTFEPPATTTTAAAVPATTPSTSSPATIAPEDIELQQAGPFVEFGVWLSRLAVYAVLVVLLGVAATLLWVVSPTTPMRPRLARLALGAAGGLIVADAALFVFALANAAAVGVTDAVRPRLVGEFLGTRFGTVVVAQGAVGLLLVAASRALRAGGRRADIAIGAGGVVAAIAPALWGHAGTDELPFISIPVDWAHVVAVGTWLGGLVALSGGARRKLVDRDDVFRFSRIAGWSVVAVLVTGTISALLHLGGIGNLFGTSWGRWVIAKTLLYAGVAGLGLLMRRRVLPAFGRNPDSGLAFARVAAAEIALMVAALAVAAQLASIIPADAEEASRVQSVLAKLGDGQLNITVDPAKSGDNLIHVYVFDDTGRVDPTAKDPTMVLSQPGSSSKVFARLLTSGPGHFTGLDVSIPTRGVWTIDFTVDTGDGRQRATATLPVR